MLNLIAGNWGRAEVMSCFFKCDLILVEGFLDIRFSKEPQE